MAPVRLRHPKGVSTLQIPSDDDSFTVQDFQQQILSASDILPSRQAGYPPRSLTLIPELPFSSLGIKSGDQVIVSEFPGPDSSGRSHLGTVPVPASASPSRSTDLTQPHTTPSAGEFRSDNATAGPDCVDTNDGSVLVHRVVPDDNSCLFSAAALVFEQTMSKAQGLRKIVADGIRNDPETYNDAILGMLPAQYIQMILKPTTWGGAIELGILAKHYGVEIASIDVETGRIDHFSPPDSNNNGMRCILIYSGIHYDAASLAPTREAPDEWHQTLFPVSSAGSKADPVLVAAKKLANVLRAKKAFTNTSTFDLKCEQCGKGLKGEKEARAHAEQTGHVRFGEY